MSLPAEAGATDEATTLSGVRLSRRAFLQAAGLTAVTAAAGGPILGATRPLTQSGGADLAAQAPDRIGDLAAALGYDVEAIFRFVADEVRYEPYAGILRGARGTLGGRAGNSADQALLLAALLDAALIDYRFAVGELDDASAAAIVDGATTDVEEYRRQITDALLQAGPGGRPDPPRIDADLRSRLAAVEPAADAVIAWATDQLDGTVGLIEDVLASAGVDLPGTYSTMPDRERRGHVWIQVDNGNEWLNLDPTLKTHAVGHAVAPIAETMDALPDDLAHRVELAVIVESIEGTDLREVEHLRYSERADLLAGQPIMLMNVRPDGLAGIGIGIVDALLGQDAFLAGLVAGEAFVLSEIPMSFGEVESTTAADELLAPAGNETVAQWLELTLRSPDAEPIVIRRIVFDRRGPEARAASVVDRRALLPVEPIGGSATPDDAHVARTAMWLAIATGGSDLESPVLAVDPEDPVMPALIPAYHHLMTEAAGHDLLLPAGVHAFIDAPNVSGWSIGPIAGTDETLVAADILHRSRGLLPVMGSPPTHDPALMAGVVAHVTERMIMLEHEGPDPEAEPVGLSVGGIFEQAEREGIGVRLLTKPAPELALPVDAAARLEAALARGWVAILPEQPVTIAGRARSGWWLIDPRSGRAVDETDDGRGSETIDYLAIVKEELATLPRWARMAACLGFFSGGFGNLLLNLAKDEVSSPSGKNLMSLLIAANTVTGAYTLAVLGETCRLSAGSLTAS